MIHAFRIISAILYSVGLFELIRIKSQHNNAVTTVHRDTARTSLFFSCETCWNSNMVRRSPMPIIMTFEKLRTQHYFRCWLGWERSSFVLRFLHSAICSSHTVQPVVRLPEANIHVLTQRTFMMIMMMMGWIYHLIYFCAYLWVRRCHAFRRERVRESAELNFWHKFDVKNKLITPQFFNGHRMVCENYSIEKIMEDWFATYTLCNDVTILVYMSWED